MAAASTLAYCNTATTMAVKKFYSTSIGDITILILRQHNISDIGWSRSFKLFFEGKLQTLSVK
jgi:hypothetical protein